MARISRRRGPTANFELTATPTTLPGFTISRYFDDGELLIAFTITIDNTAASPITPNVNINLDGTSIIPGNFLDTLQAASRRTVSRILLEPITAGVHTIELQVSNGATAGELVLANTAELLVIQLPQWDSATDIL